MPFKGYIFIMDYVNHVSSSFEDCLFLYNGKASVDEAIVITE
jgi:hypothetical protein